MKTHFLAKGAENCCFLERAADFFNAPARNLWSDRSIEIIKKDENVELKINPQSEHNVLVYLTLSMFAIIPFIIGSSLKELAILTNNKSRSYQIIINDLLELEKAKVAQKQTHERISHLKRVIMPFWKERIDNIATGAFSYNSQKEVTIIRRNTYPNLSKDKPSDRQYEKFTLAFQQSKFYIKKYQEEIRKNRTELQSIRKRMQNIQKEVNSLFNTIS